MTRTLTTSERIARTERIIRVAEGQILLPFSVTDPAALLAQATAAWLEARAALDGVQSLRNAEVR